MHWAQLTIPILVASCMNLFMEIQKAIGQHSAETGELINIQHDEIGTRHPQFIIIQIDIQPLRLKFTVTRFWIVEIEL